MIRTHFLAGALILCFSALAVLCACERERKEIGSPGTAFSGPSYTAAAERYAVLQPAHLLDVAPSGEEKKLDGQALYMANCSSCHQATGQGIPAAFPPLDGSSYVVGSNTERMAAIMIYGLIGPIKVKGMQYTSAMPGLGPTLKDDELASIATYIRSAWSNNAEPVAAEVFAQARNKWGSRGPFNIAELGEEQ